MDKEFEKVKLENRIRRLEGRPQNQKSPGVLQKLKRKLLKINS